MVTCRWSTTKLNIISFKRNHLYCFCITELSFKVESSILADLHSVSSTHKYSMYSSRNAFFHSESIYSFHLPFHLWLIILSWRYQLHLTPYTLSFISRFPSRLNHSSLKHHETTHTPKIEIQINYINDRIIQLKTITATMLAGPGYI